MKLKEKMYSFGLILLSATPIMNRFGGLSEIFDWFFAQGQLTVLFIILGVGGLALVLLGTRAGRGFLGAMLILSAFWSLTWRTNILFIGLLIFGIVLIGTAFLGGGEEKKVEKEKIIEKTKETPSASESKSESSEEGPEKILCPNCRSEIPKESKFCLECGQDLTPSVNEKKKKFSGESEKLGKETSQEEGPVVVVEEEKEMSEEKESPEEGEVKEESSKFCMFCGTEIPPESEYCPKCGEEVR